ncbi:phage integrase [Vibrio cholerae]|uniref:Phage integrase n=1 Tax=Vibrio cholerae TaxID=666 RepID=A0A655TAF2_VIBCL|nr:phage integrase [Vibrio cholerae]CSB33153.1 phage integrase [Vibrio cholerae]CSD25357.1 phage integrase [Vibrio cholerae]
MKLICFCWLYIAGHHRKGAVIKPSTLIARFSKLSILYKFIDSKGFQSINSLSSEIVFSEFCEYLKGQNYSSGQVEGIYNALMHVKKQRGISPYNLKYHKDAPSVNLVGK